MKETPNENNQILTLTQRINDLERLHQEGRLHLGVHEAEVLRDLHRVRRDGNGLVISETVSPSLRTIALGTSYAANIERDVPTGLADPTKAQRELFSIFQDLFGSLSGKDHTRYSSYEEIERDILSRLNSDYDNLATEFNGTIDRLVAYYNLNQFGLAQEAKRIAGLKLVIGGQSQFLGSQLSGVRQMALYADTILIPDPIFHVIETQAMDVPRLLRIGTSLFHLLALKPLVDAELPYPAVFVFPSFERSLETHDVVTQQGIFQLVVRLVRGAAGIDIQSMDEAADFALKREAEFMAAVTRNQLFLPPGHEPSTRIDAYEACELYISEVTGERPAAEIERIKSMPRGYLVLQAIMERVGPQYHLLENADHLSAQPMVVLPVHWHYLERVSVAATNDLERKGILPKGSLGVYRGLQDSSLAWLGNVPIDALVSLRRDEANKDFRKRMAELAKELDSASISDVEKIAREVAHGLASIINTHQKEIRELEAKWATKYAKTLLFAGGASILTLAAPYLPILGAIAGTGSAVAAAGSIAVAYAKDKIDEVAERRRLSRSLIGVLASAKKASK
jgi:hypothetical protein